MTPPEQPERPRTEGNVTRIPTAFETRLRQMLNLGSPTATPAGGPSPH
jgi:hypothetical protein